MKFFRITILGITCILTFLFVGIVHSAITTTKPTAAATASSRPAVTGSPFSTKSSIGTNCKGTPNTNPIIDVPLIFVRNTTRGKRYLAGGNSDDHIHLIHVYGKPYDWGRAVGELMKEELNIMVPQYFSYLEAMIQEYLKHIPHFLAEIIAKYGLHFALDLNYEITKKYTPERYDQELHGLADGSGIDVKQFRRLNLLPELIKAACSMYGAWGVATERHGLMQLRALDWDSHAPIKKWASMVVYHPDDGTVPFSNIGYPGLIGSITGYSASSIGISEKVWLGQPDSQDSRFGMPWTYVLRDVLQYATDLDSALSILKEAHRTCSIHVGVGSSKTGEFRGVQYSYKHLNIFNWMDQPASEAHPTLTNVVYWDKHVQPSSNPCFGSLLQHFYGHLDVENTRQIAAEAQTGDMQIAIFDFKGNEVYVANARADGESGPDNAYDRSYVRFNMTAIFAEKL